MPPTVTPSPLYLVLGEEEFLRSRAIADTVKQVRVAWPACEVTEVTASEISPGGWAQLLSPSLFGEQRVIVIHACQDATKDSADALIGWLAGALEDMVLIVAHAGGNKGKGLADKVKTAGASVVACRKITSSRDRRAFVLQEIARHGGNLGRDSQRQTVADEVAETIIETVGTGLRELSAACQQLVADTGGEITTDTVRRYYTGKAETTGFVVADAVMAGDVAGALESLRWAISVGVDPVLIAAALADGVRSVAKVHAAGRGNPYQLASSLGMPPWKVERAQRQASRWDTSGLAAAVHCAARANADVKGGAEDRVYALERAVMAMAQARGQSLRGQR